MEIKEFLKVNYEQLIKEGFPEGKKVSGIWATFIWLFLRRNEKYVQDFHNFKEKIAWQEKMNAKNQTSPEGEPIFFDPAEELEPFSSFWRISEPVDPSVVQLPEDVYFDGELDKIKIVDYSKLLGVISVDEAKGLQKYISTNFGNPDLRPITLMVNPTMGLPELKKEIEELYKSSVYDKARSDWSSIQRKVRPAPKDCVNYLMYKEYYVGESEEQKRTNVREAYSEVVGKFIGEDSSDPMFEDTDRPKSHEVKRALQGFDEFCLKAPHCFLLPKKRQASNKS